MPQIRTDLTDPNALSTFDRYQVYNGMDCMVTLEVFEQTHPLLDNTTSKIYDFERDLQAAALDMMARGIAVDLAERDRRLEILRKRRLRLISIFDQYVEAIGAPPTNPASTQQLQHLFYEVMKQPVIRTRKKGEWKQSMDREALEKLSDYYYAMPLVNVILAIRDLDKTVQVLSTAISIGGRFFTSFNIGGTETGRWSSSSNAFGLGGNAQNIAEENRGIFIADNGYKFAYIDLEQAESRVVGLIIQNLFGDRTYLEACGSGDLHTAVTKLVWPNLPWTGILKEDKEIVERKFYRDFSYRDMAKRGGHGSNYGGKPPTIAKNLKVSVGVVEAFQRAYFGAFPGIRRWHFHVARELQLRQRITTIFGRRRDFFARPNDDTTLRAAIAFEPQSVIADVLNSALLTIWKEGHPLLLPSAQIHDAVLLQFREADEAVAVDTALRLMAVPIGGIVIPAEAKTGWNFAKKSPKNPDGLAKWTGKDERTRTANRGLDRGIPGIHGIRYFPATVQTVERDLMLGGSV